MFLSFSSVISSAWSAVWPYLVAILFFGIVIFIHELGHFSFAKLFGVKVNQFAIGMGPTIAKFGKKETKYSLRLLPFGGFVAMEGEDEDSEDDRSFSKKAVWKRILIVSAGAITNLLAGVIIMAILLAQSNLIGTTQVHSFHEGAKTQETGLQQHDVITKIDGRRVFSNYDLGYLLSRSEDGTYTMEVTRDGEKVTLNAVTFNTREEEGQMVVEYDFIIVGVDPTFSSVVTYAVRGSLSMGRIVWLSLFDMLTGKYGLSDLSGPVGTINYIAQAAEQTTAGSTVDFSSLLTMMALIMINIGIFNLLPVPGLDGGRLLFMFVELITRRRVPAKYEGWIHAIGLILLVVLVVVVTFSDILGIIRG